MVRYYKKNLTDFIWKRWIIVVIILALGLINANAQQKCCYSTTSQMSSPPSSYRLNITASHVDSKKNRNLYLAAISFQQGYTVIGEGFSPFSYVKCIQKTGTEIPQYECESKDKEMLFVEFDLSILPPPSTNTTVTASSVFIFGDQCQNVQFCTDLAAKDESENSDKVSLGPLGTLPKIAVIIGGIVIGITFLVACYLVYRRSRPDQSHRDRSITPGNNKKDSRLFSPNSLLRDDDDDDDYLPSDEPPKNTLIQFDSNAAPERSKSVQNKKLQSKSSTRKTKDKNHHEIDIHDNPKSNSNSGRDKIPTVAIEMSDNNNSNSNSLHRTKSKSRNSNERESRSDKPQRRSNSKDVEDDDRKVDRTSSRRHNSHSRSRKDSSSPSPTSKSTSDSQKSSRTGQTDRDSTSKNRSFRSDNSDVDLDRKKSNKHRDLISRADTESATSSSDLGDRLPLAMLANATKSPPSGQSKPDNDDDDDDTTPLGQISSYGASKNLLNYDLGDNNDDSALGEMLGIADYINKSSDDFTISKEKKSETINDDEVPIGQLKSG